MSERGICKECDWVGDWSDLLTATDPFNDGCLIYACPQCKAVERIFPACDVKDCNREATCGTPTLHGYKTTCFDHFPLAKDARTLERKGGA